jgi:hypothetical protein
MLPSRSHSGGLRPLLEVGLDAEVHDGGCESGSEVVDVLLTESQAGVSGQVLREGEGEDAAVIAIRLYRDLPGVPALPLSVALLFRVFTPQMVHPSPPPLPRIPCKTIERMPPECRARGPEELLGLWDLDGLTGEAETWRRVVFF